MSKDITDTLNAQLTDCLAYIETLNMSSIPDFISGRLSFNRDQVLDTLAIKFPRLALSLDEVRRYKLLADTLSIDAEEYVHIDKESQEDTDFFSSFLGSTFSNEQDRDDVLRLQEKLLGKIDSEHKDITLPIDQQNHIGTENSITTTSDRKNIVPVSILKNGSSSRNN